MINQFNNFKLYVLPSCKLLIALFTKIRNNKATNKDFFHYSKWIFRLLIDYSLNLIEYEKLEIETPIGYLYTGLKWNENNLFAVSIVRAGDSVESTLREMMPEIPIGKILIQRSKVTKKPKLYYIKLPKINSNSKVLLMDPMLATGGTACMAIKILIDNGVKEENIIFVNLLSVNPGLETVFKNFPSISVVTASVENDLSKDAYMIPGIGDFGDRFFGTNI